MEEYDTYVIPGIGLVETIEQVKDIRNDNPLINEIYRIESQDKNLYKNKQDFLDFISDSIKNKNIPDTKTALNTLSSIRGLKIERSYDR